MSRKPNALVIGAFVMGAIALAVAAVLVFGSGRLFRKVHPYVCYFTGSLNGLRVGAPVKFRGVELGEVTDIRLQLHEPMGDPRLAVLIALDQDRIASLGGVVRMDNRAEAMQAIENGLRAQLQSESIVTGVLFVQLDMKPDEPAVFAQPADAPVPEIPTIPTTLEQAQETIAEIVSEIRKVDIAGLVTAIRDAATEVRRLTASPKLEDALGSLDETLDTVRRLATTLDGRVDPIGRDVAATVRDLRQTLVRTDATLADVRGLLAPDAPVPVGFVRAMAEVGAAARALRSLAETIERHPESIVFGKSEP